MEIISISKMIAYEKMKIKTSEKKNEKEHSRYVRVVVSSSNIFVAHDKREIL